MKLLTTDPMEQIIEKALQEVGEPYLIETQNAANLDFYLPLRSVYIEVKQFHSDRIAVQMQRDPNIIVAQGRKAVEMLAVMILRGNLK